MRVSTSGRSASATPAGPPGRPGSFPVAHQLVPVTVIVAVIALFVAPFTLHQLFAPIGWDSAGYAWRTNFALHYGVRHLPGWLPAPGPTNAGRPGFVVIGGLLSSVLRTSPLTMTAVMPAVAAAATGLAAGALTSVALGESRWVSAAVALGVGTSVFMVHIVNVEGYQDGAIDAAVVLAAFVAVVLFATSWRAAVGAAVLTGAAGVIHWELFQVVAVVLVVTAVVYLPAWFLRWRREHRVPWSPISVRLLLVAGAGAAIAGFWILVVVSAPLPRADLVAGQLATKLRRDLPAFWPWLTLPLAGIGAAILADRASTGAGEPAARQRMFLALALSWSEVTMAAFVAQRWFHRALPTHRLLAFDLAIPILAVLAVCWGTGALSRMRTDEPSRSGRARAAVAVVVVGAVLVASAITAGRQWVTFRPVVRPMLVREAGEAALALQRAHISVFKPVVFAVEDQSTDPWSQVWLLAHTIRAGLPPERLPTVYFSVALPWHALPTRSSPGAGSSGTGFSSSGPSAGASGTNTGSTPFWQYARDVRTVAFDDPVVFVTASSNPFFGRWVQTHPDSLVAPGLALVSGGEQIARVRAAGSPAAPTRMSAARLAGLALAAVVILYLVGIGWCRTLFGDLLHARDRILLAPAVGLGLTVLGGTLLNAIGIPLRGAGAWVILALIGAAGLASASLVGRASRSS